MKKLLSFFMLFIIFVNTSAKEITIKDAQKVALNFINEFDSSVTTKSDWSNQLQLVYTAQNSKLKTGSLNNYYYVFNIGDNNGFIIISAQDLIAPVIAYSKEGRYNVDEQSKNVSAKEWMRAIEQKLQAGIDKGNQPTTEIKNKWKTYLIDNKLKANNIKSVAPLVTTQWDQGEPYNTKIPGNINGRILTGCVATAMAQIMKKYNHPASGKGIVGNYKLPYQQLSFPAVDLTQYSYDWSNMTDTYDNNSLQVQNDAVALLMYHLGMSTRMKYTIYEGSGTSMVNAIQAFCSNFGYDKSIQYRSQKTMDKEKWVKTFRDEFDKGRPVMLSGSGAAPDDNHAFIACGYEDRGDDFYSYFNWGWSGSSDGYYNVESPSGYTNMTMIYNIKPDEGTFAYRVISLLEADDRFYEDENDSYCIYANKSEVFDIICYKENFDISINIEDDRIIYKLALFDSNNQFVTFIDKKYVPKGFRKLHDSFLCEITTEVPAGRYEMRVMKESIAGSGNFDILENTVTNFKASIVVKNAVKKADIKQTSTKPLTVSTQTIDIKDQFKVSISCKNNGSTIYAGLIGVALVNDNNEILGTVGKQSSKESSLKSNMEKINQISCQIQNNILEPIPIGTYKLKPVYTYTSNDPDWKFLPTIDNSVVDYISINIVNEFKDVTLVGIKAENKIYDGKMNVSISDWGHLDGIDPTHDVRIDTTYLSACFSDANAGSAIPIRFPEKIVLLGKDKDYYNFIQPENVTASILKAPLTITTRTISIPQGTDPKKIKEYLIDAYDITGFIYGENSAVFQHMPTVNLDEDITLSTPVGVYTDKILVSGATCNNYDITYQSNILKVTSETDDIIFDPIKAKTYGDAPFILTARHTKGKEISFRSSDESLISIEKKGNKYIAIIHGAGKVSLYAESKETEGSQTETKEQILNIQKANLIVRTLPFLQSLKGSRISIPLLSYTCEGFISGNDLKDFTEIPYIRSNIRFDTEPGVYPGSIYFSSKGEHPNYEITNISGDVEVHANKAFYLDKIWWPKIDSKKYGDSDIFLYALSYDSFSEIFPFSKTIFYESEATTIADVKYEIFNANNYGEKITILKTGRVPIEAFTVDEKDLTKKGMTNKQIIHILPALLTIRPDNVIRFEGEPNPEFTYTVSGLQYKDTKVDLGTISITTTADKNSPVGEYDIIASGAVNGNYIISYNIGKLTVKPVVEVKKLSIKGMVFNNKVYDGKTDASISDWGSLDGIEPGDDIKIDKNSLVSAFEKADAADSISITILSLKLEGPNASKYKLIYPSNLKASISKADMIITARSQSILYGTNPTTLNKSISNAYDINGYVNNESVAVLETMPTVSIDTSITSSTPVGIYSNKVLITGAKAKNYNIQHKNGTLTIQQNTSASYITFDSISYKKYGDSSFTLSGRHSLGKTVSYRSSDKNIISIEQKGTLWEATILKSGQVTLYAEFDGDEDVSAESQSQMLNIGKAELTVTAQNQIRNYGQPNPNISSAYTFSKFIKSSDIDDFSSLPVATISASITTTSAIGTYKGVINISGGSHPNYTLKYVSADLTINAATVDINWISIGNKTYGDSDFNISANHTSGNTVSYESLNSDIISIYKDSVTWKGKIKKVGTAVLKASTIAENNYEASQKLQEIQVLPAPLTIRPDDSNRFYGESNPEFTYTISGLQYKDAKADLGTISITTTADKNSPAGEYDIIASGAANRNYIIGYNQGTLTIKKVGLTLTLSDNQEDTYSGDPLYIIPATLIGWANGNPQEIKYTYTRNNQDNSYALHAGVYKVTANVDGDDNHKPVSTTITYTVHKAKPQITLTSKSVDYTGYPIPIDIPQIDGSNSANNLFVTIEYEGTDSTNYTRTTIPPTEIGDYKVYASVAGDNNHISNNAETILTIGKKLPILTISDVEFVYDGMPKTIAASISPSILDIRYTYEGIDSTTYLPTDSAPINVGKYKITASFVGNESYKATSVSGILTIKKKIASITMQNKTTPYTGKAISIEAPITDPSGAIITITYKKMSQIGLLLSDKDAPVSGGVYQVTAHFEGNDNYLPASATAILTITDAGVPILTMNNKTVTYDGQPHAIESTKIESAGGNYLKVSYLYNGPNYPVTPVAPTNAGIYTVNAFTPADSNFKAGSVTAILTIKKADQNITFDKNQLKDRSVNETPFKLSATSTSGLPVIFKSGNPDLAIIDDNTITLKKAGVIAITATQQGNENYNSKSVTYQLNILEQETMPEITAITVNGEILEVKDTMHYDMGDTDLTLVRIDIETPVGTTILGKENSFIETLVKPMIKVMDITIASANKKTTRTYILKIEKRFNFDDIIKMKWNRALVLSEDRLLEYHITGYQWYKNNQPIIGATGKVYISDVQNKNLLEEAKYHVGLTVAEGELRSGQKDLKLKSMDVKSYPIPLKSGQILFIDADVDENILLGAVIRLYTPFGKLMKIQKVEGRISQIIAPQTPGVYIAVFNGTYGFSKTMKIIVE